MLWPQLRSDYMVITSVPLFESSLCTNISCVHISHHFFLEKQKGSSIIIILDQYVMSCYVAYFLACMHTIIINYVDFS